MQHVAPVYVGSPSSPSGCHSLGRAYPLCPHNLPPWSQGGTLQPARSVQYPERGRLHAPPLMTVALKLTDPLHRCLSTQYIKLALDHPC